MSRSPSRKTSKILWGFSGYQCAHPDCTVKLIERATESSPDAIIGEECHIHSRSPDGPRGDGGLSLEELNAPSNLILLCPTHHRLVDGHPKTYTVEVLRKWKQNHEAKIAERVSPDSNGTTTEVLAHPSFPTHLVDQTIEEEVWKLRKARFFVEFNVANESLVLGRKIAVGDLSGGTDVVRCRGLAWCSRFLSRSDEFGKAEEYRELASQLGTCPEVDIAQAFLLSQKGNKTAGLKILAEIDSAASRSAALMIVSHHETVETTVEWISTAGFGVAHLSSEGKYILLTHQLELGHWNVAVEIVDSLSSQDLEDIPVLHYWSALTLLTAVVPPDLRRVVLAQVPIFAYDFPLASDEVGFNVRRRAYNHFRRAMATASELGCQQAATLNEEYALWLTLRDPNRSAQGKRRLKQKLCTEKLDLHFIHLGVQFGIKLDISQVENEIDRQVALRGGITREAAVARFALAFTKESPEEVANYVAQHFEELGEFLDEKQMRILQIRMLSRARLTDRATKILDSLVEDGLPQTEELRLRGVIEESKDDDLIALRKKQFERSQLLDDLVALVVELETHQKWEELFKYANLLFEETRSTQDAERFATALANARKTEQLIHFLDHHSDFVVHSNQLKFLYAWALYHEGKLVEARTALERLSDAHDDLNHRILWVNLAISVGDWNSLNTFIANEYERQNERSAKELIDTAQLAVRLDSPYAKDIVLSAVEKSENDANVLVNAYFLATSAGWEDEDNVSQWLIKAIELSGEEGPLQPLSIKEVLNRKPSWDRWESETLGLLTKGEIPLFVAARSLRKSLIDMSLFPALANQTQDDVRRRILIPSFSGNCRPVKFHPTEVTAGFDVTALLTLSFLNLLDQTFGAFKNIFVPHSTFAWLFDEKLRAKFHQPSRIRDSHQIRNFITNKLLGEYVPNVIPDRNLASQIGDELASMVAEAERASEDEKTQYLVVRTAPVYRSSSIEVEEVDLSEYAQVLSSCSQVVEKLKQRGILTAEEVKGARTYLQLHERPWPNQPEIEDSAVLFLDDSAVSYFLHLGILGKISAAGLRPIITSRVIAEANALIDYESISNEVNVYIERIRSSLCSRIEFGSIKVGRKQLSDEPEEPLLSEHPTTDVFSLAHSCDLIFSDDRFLNQRNRIEAEESSVTIASTLDLLDTLVEVGEISMEERLEHRTRLRRAGYIFIPVSAEELTLCLNASEVRDGRVLENAELKSLRESIVSVRMSNWLQFSIEAHWLESVFQAILRVLKSLWVNSLDLSDVIARSNWLVDQIDMRGWAHTLGTENGDNMVRTGRGLHILTLLAPPENVTQEMKEAYWKWIENRILVPTREQFPDLFESMIEYQKNQIADVTENILIEDSPE